MISNTWRSLKTLLFLLFVLCLFFLLSRVEAADGNTLFNTLRCGTCHKKDTGTAFPSLKAIAGNYQAKEEQLVKYLKSEAEPIVNPGKKASMKIYLEKTKALSDEERKSLAGYMLEQGK